jgi:hypothetical protein
MHDTLARGDRKLAREHVGQPRSALGATAREKALSFWGSVRGQPTVDIK